MHSLFLREVSIDWDAVSDYTQHIAALHSFDRLIFQKQIAFFTGESGSGKATLARGDSFKPRFLSALLFLFFTGGKFL